MNAVATDTSVAVSTTNAWFRSFMWLIKREMWEHRGRFLITPLVVSGIIIAGILFGISQMDERALSVSNNGIQFGESGTSGNAAMIKGFHFASSMAFSLPFAIVMFFVTIYYALDTLYADRRDRSILFWKSLPVSDLDTVLSKLAIAVVVSPLITAAIVLTTLYLVYGALSIGLLAHGQEVGGLWSGVPFFQNLVLHFYTVIAVGLWLLPVWAWCMLVSSWAQRSVFLWATVPVAGLAFLEYQTLGTRHVIEFLRIRFTGFVEVMARIPADVEQAFKDQTVTSFNLSDFLTPGAYFSSPHLWIGLLMTAGLVTATIWMRRYRETT